MDIYTGRRMRIEKIDVTLPSGNIKERVVVRPGGAVAMLPIEGDSCYLIKQYRFAIDHYIYEVPAGTMDEAEKPVETAYRELIEETQLKAGNLIPKGYIYTTPGYTDEVIHLFEARDLSPSKEYDPDEDEIIEVVKLKLSRVEEMIEDGSIIDAKTICLIYRCLGKIA